VIKYAICMEFMGVAFIWAATGYVTLEMNRSRSRRLTDTWLRTNGFASAPQCSLNILMLPFNITNTY
jgi:hypothetical protein